MVDDDLDFLQLRRTFNIFDIYNKMITTGNNHKTGEPHKRSQIAKSKQILQAHTDAMESQIYIDFITCVTSNLLLILFLRKG